MACHLSAKPLPEPMLNHCQLDDNEQNSVNFESKHETFSFKKIHLKMLSTKCPPSCLGLKGLTLFVLEIGIVQDNKVNTLAADALDPCVARTSAPMVLNLLNKQILVFPGGRFQWLVPSQY